MSSPVATRALLAYSLPSAPISMLMMMLVVYLAPYYAAEMHLGLAAVGLIFSVARLWDAVIDPIVGNLSDRTRSRLGRRKPWIAAGTPMLMLAVWLFFQPPEGIGIGYLAVVAFFFYVTVTMVQIPYLSWGAELSRDYHERIRINSYREGATMIGILMVAAVPLILLRGQDASVSDIMGVFTVLVMIMLPLTVIPALSFAPQGISVPGESLSLPRALYALRVNRPFLRLLLASLFIWVGGNIYNATSLFLIKDALGFAPTLFLVLMATQFGVGLLTVPLVIRVGKRLGKHRTLLLMGMGFFPILWLLLLVEPQNTTQIFIVYILKGAMTAAIWIMPPALVADSIEHGMLEGIGDDTALYMSLYFFVQKLAAAIAVGFALPLAALLGFDPGQIESTTDFTGLKFVSVILPSLVAFPAVLLLFNYPITEQRHAEIRAQLRASGIDAG